MSPDARLVVGLLVIAFVLALAAAGLFRLADAVERRDAARRAVHAEAHRLARLP